jgi:hypothetical protein
MSKANTFALTMIFLLLLAGWHPGSAFTDWTCSTAKPLAQKSLSLQAGAGLLVSPLLIQTKRQELDYAAAFIRAGYIFTDPLTKPYLPRGNVEGLVQASCFEITEGFSGNMQEVALLFRYNVIYPGWPIAPYMHVGVGLLHNTLYKDRSQDLIGQAVEFTPQASLGFRCLFGDEWTIDVEAMVHHISNAGLDPRNIGVNAFGGFIAVTRFFGPSAK